MQIKHWSCLPICFNSCLLCKPWLGKFVGKVNGWREALPITFGITFLILHDDSFLQTTYGVAHHSNKTNLWVGFILCLTKNNIFGSWIASCTHWTSQAKRTTWILVPWMSSSMMRALATWKKRKIYKKIYFLQLKMAMTPSRCSWCSLKATMQYWWLGDYEEGDKTTTSRPWCTKQRVWKYYYRFGMCFEWYLEP